MQDKRYFDHVTDPETGYVIEVRDTIAREQLTLKKETFVVETLPTISGMSPEEIERALQRVYYCNPYKAENIAAGVEKEVYVLQNTATPPNTSYEWMYIGTTRTDLAGFSSKGHTHEVIPETDVEDHQFTPSGTLTNMSFSGSQGSTGDNTHSHTFTPSGTVTGNFSGDSDVTTAEMTGITLTKTKRRLDTDVLNVTPVSSVNFANSTTNGRRATGSLSAAGVWSSDSVFNGIQVTDGVLSFVTKKLVTSDDTVTSLSATIEASKVTLGGAETVTSHPVANGSLIDDERDPTKMVMTDVSVNDSGHDHRFTPSGTLTNMSFSGTQGTTNSVTHSHDVTPSGSVTGTISMNPVTLKHKVDNKKIRTMPDQEDEGSHAYDWYGIEYPVEETDPVKTRIGNMDMHRKLPIQTRMRRCLLKDDGTVYNYLDPKDSRYYAYGSKDEFGHDLSGLPSELGGSIKVDYTDPESKVVAAQVMVEIPEHWRKVYTYKSDDPTEGDILRAIISPYEQDATTGWVHVKKGYISAYEASIGADQNDGDTYNKLCSISRLVPLTVEEEGEGGATVEVEVPMWENDGGTPKFTCDLAGATQQSDIHSLLPKTNVNMNTFRTAARARKAYDFVGTDYRWNMLVYDMYLTVYWLFVIEYANLNSQAAFTTVPTAEGFKQGGLGNGVTTVSGENWNTFNGYLPFVPCGATTVLGNDTGEVIVSVPSTLSRGYVTTNSYRGIENIFGHIWKFADGIKYQGNDTNQLVLRCDDPENYSSDANSTNYTSIGHNVGDNGYKTEIMVYGIDDTNDGDINCAACGGASAGALKCYCDYNSQPYSTSALSSSSFYCCLLGGYANYGTNAGLACVYSRSSVSYTSAIIGSRLCFYEK